MEYSENLNCHCGLRLSSGRLIFLDKLTQSRTYVGLLEGTPSKKTNDLAIKWHFERVERENATKGKPFLIRPERRDYFKELGDMQPTLERQADRPTELKHVPEWLPPIVCVGDFSSPQPARNPKKHASSLTIIWYQSDFGFDPRAFNLIREVEWDQLATDWDY
ncbi:MAG: hypothetical protein U0930_05285 [Pirellulales bacterium]